MFENCLKVVASAAALAVMMPGTSHALSSVSLDSGDAGTAFSATWGDTIGGETLDASSLWTFESLVGNVWNFTTTINNNASSGARIVSWGFDTDPGISNFNLSAPSDWAYVSDPNGSVQVENCVFGGQNCNGGAGAGINAGDALTFEFSFESDADSLTFANLLTRWQSVGVDDEDSTVLSSDVNIVPIPAAGFLILAMMGGFGVSAYAKRRQLS